MVNATILTSADLRAASSATKPSFGVATKYAIGVPTGILQTCERYVPVREMTCGKNAMESSSFAEYQIALVLIYSTAALSPARTSAGSGPARIAMISPDHFPEVCFAPA